MGIVTFKDDLTIHHIAERFKELKDAVSKYGEVVINIGEVKKFDVAAIQMLISAQKECERAHCKITFQPSDEITNLSSLLGVRL